MAFDTITTDLNISEIGGIYMHDIVVLIIYIIDLFCVDLTDRVRNLTLLTA